jgi:hypothetical protein
MSRDMYLWRSLKKYTDSIPWYRAVQTTAQRRLLSNPRMWLISTLKTKKKIRGNNSLMKELLSFMLWICLWEPLLVVLLQCCEKKCKMKHVKSFVHVVSVWYALKTNFNDSKYKVWTTCGQNFIRKESIIQLWLWFICRPYRLRISRTLSSFIIVFLNDAHSV